MVSKYQAVKEFLVRQRGDTLRIGFDQVAEIMGGLPEAAYTYRAWWSNNPGFSHARHGWLAAGWRTARVDMDAKELTFERVPTPGAPRSAECLCGCGGVPARGEFLPGHDQRLRTRIENTAGGLGNLWQAAQAISSYLEGETTEIELGRILRRHWGRGERPEPVQRSRPLGIKGIPEEEPEQGMWTPSARAPLTPAAPSRKIGRMSLERVAPPAEPGILALETTLGEHELHAIADRLASIGRVLEPDDLLPTLRPEASAFVRQDAFAFCLAACLDRGMPSEVAWTIPHDLKEILGHLDPHQIDVMPREALAEALGRLPRQPRFVNDAPDTLKDLAHIVVDEFAGNAAGIWAQGNAADVKAVFRRVHGVGPGIASMAVLLIEKAFGVRFSDLDHAAMDIKADVHTMRVLYRLGAAPAMTVADAIEAARRLNPAYPGEIDGALWSVGRRWCRPQLPDCAGCPMNNLCARVGVASR
jgi:endonuclease III